MDDPKPKIEIIATDVKGEPIAAVAFYKHYWEEGRLDVVNVSYFRLFQEIMSAGREHSVARFETKGL